MFRERPAIVLLFCTIVTAGTGIVQYLNPELRIFDGGLIIAILLTVFLEQSKYTLLFGAVSVLLIVLSAFYSRDSDFSFAYALSHLFSVLIAILITIAVLYIKKLYHSIEAEKQQVNALFYYATQGIILSNKKGEILLVNPQAEQLFGYDRNELLHKNIEVLLPKWVRSKHVQYREQFYHHPASRPMGHGRDLFATKKNGEQFPVEVSLSYYEQKNHFYVVVFVIDITQRKLAEQKMVEQHEELERVTADMRKLNTELESKVNERTTILREALGNLERSQAELSTALSKEKELSEIKSRFVSMASHEFRTPLSTVLSSALLIQNYVKETDQEKRHRHVTRIREAVKHLNELLEDFLSLGRIEEGRIRTEVCEFNVRQVVYETVEEMKPVLKSGQQLQVSFSGDTALRSDKRLLKNVLLNLLGNAIKFSNENTPIEVCAVVDEKALTLSVRDRGIGIPKEDQHHLFTTFFRGKNAVNIPGTGLGLHIVQRYVELLQGSIQLESELGVGTTVTITVPGFQQAG
jgi:PAS domain S-box-containing protein